MRVVIEETNSESKNKRRTCVECEEDNLPVHEAMDMLLRSLLGCGYSRDAVAYYFNEMSKQYTEAPEEAPEEEQKPLEKTSLLNDEKDDDSSE